MPNSRSFKSDESFLEKLAIGAIGTKKVRQDLSQQGHQPIELERGSASFKIWKAIKIKRIRVPDILCVKCGTRVESRAKTQLEISMSHSVSDPERGWDASLADEDYVALVRCERIGDRPIDWRAGDLVQYLSVKELRRAYARKQVVVQKPKGAQEGFELRLTWPSAIASADGKVLEAKRGCIKYARSSDGRQITLQLVRDKFKLSPLVKKNDVVKADQFLACVVLVTRSLPCFRQLSAQEYLKLLGSVHHSDRYTAIKALSSFTQQPVDNVLLGRLEDEKEHIYIRLEAALVLMRHGQVEGHRFLDQTLRSEYLPHRLETVIVLAEVGTDEARKSLLKILSDDSQHHEIRAGAAWSLGEVGGREALDGLVNSFLSVDHTVRTEAARALAKLALHLRPELLKQFPVANPTARPGIAWALSKAGGFSVNELLNGLVDEDARHWIAYLLGTQKPEAYLGQIEALKHKDPEVYFAVTVLWKILTSWVAHLEEY